MVAAQGGAAAELPSRPAGGSLRATLSKCGSWSRTCFHALRQRLLSRWRRPRFTPCFPCRRSPILKPCVRRSSLNSGFPRVPRRNSPSLTPLVSKKKRKRKKTQLKLGRTLSTQSSAFDFPMNPLGWVEGGGREGGVALTSDPCELSPC